ncbi:A-agglutinin anchorage subunit-like [Gouania willdenowi]|uniref:A-agglutinin anchorage subunit-like n=1 Tax=Gouania willdenowi TaxID=441366 RepID=UPI001055C243|nr:A-agglutinin anchorage subunit-like [Gouania willdenowi]
MMLRNPERSKSSVLTSEKDDDGYFHSREKRSDLSTNTTANMSLTATSDTTAFVTKPSLPSRFLISVEVNLTDPQAVDFLNNFLANTAFPLKISESLQLDSTNITTVCSPTNDSYWCSCEGQYRWSCDQCEKYGHCDNITNDDTCGCITDRPSDGSHCRSPHYYNFTPCHHSTTRSPTTIISADPTTNITTDISTTTEPATPLTKPSLPSRFLISVEVNLTDPQAVDFLNNFLANTAFPLKISESLQLDSTNITTVCSPTNDSYWCSCEGQYRWSCDQCEKYGHCDNITNDDTCGCITDRPSDGSHCRSPHYYNFTPCHHSTTRSPTTIISADPTTNITTDISTTTEPTTPLTKPSLPSRFLISVEVNLTDPQAVDFLNNFLANTAFPLKISESLQLDSTNITTVCSPTNDSYWCSCEGQYRWSCDQCEKYGHCDNITNDDTCGCITDRPSDGSHCRSPHYYNFTPCHHSTTRSPTTIISADPTTNTTTDISTTTEPTTPLTSLTTNTTSDINTSTIETTLVTTDPTTNTTTDISTTTEPTTPLTSLTTNTTSDINTSTIETTTLVTTDPTTSTTTDISTTTEPTTPLTSLTTNTTSDINTSTIETTLVTTDPTTSTTTDISTTTEPTTPLTSLTTNTTSDINTSTIETTLVTTDPTTSTTTDISTTTEPTTPLTSLTTNTTSDINTSTIETTLVTTDPTTSTTTDISTTTEPTTPLTSLTTNTTSDINTSTIETTLVTTDPTTNTTTDISTTTEPTTPLTSLTTNTTSDINTSTIETTLVTSKINNIFSSLYLRGRQAPNTSAFVVPPSEAYIAELRRCWPDSRVLFHHTSNGRALAAMHDAGSTVPSIRAMSQNTSFSSGCAGPNLWPEAFQALGRRVQSPPPQGLKRQGGQNLNLRGWSLDSFTKSSSFAGKYRPQTLG